ncbi:hypothetical protein K435DRAFT_961979 [Dendrothele bispora CBS 962.96]|uniref:P-loop containing nucleoside triphosphate hydrolase protein n=1 Tax=Dendrothele bispora (strain CBS 962.96) TaxID=1314807 RepID=A0A4S8MN54_DENBC|nr:hypothetical protein K435DRAFT_961979 [Dendrothele bispora CBS 962.96]
MPTDDQYAQREQRHNVAFPTSTSTLRKSPLPVVDFLSDESITPIRASRANVSISPLQTRTLDARRSFFGGSQGQFLFGDVQLQLEDLSKKSFVQTPSTPSKKLGGISMSNVKASPPSQFVSGNKVFSSTSSHPQTSRKNSTSPLVSVPVAVQSSGKSAVHKVTHVFPGPNYSSKSSFVSASTAVSPVKQEVVDQVKTELEEVSHKQTFRQAGTSKLYRPDSYEVKNEVDETNSRTILSSQTVFLDPTPARDISDELEEVDNTLNSHRSCHYDANQALMELFTQSTTSSSQAILYTSPPKKVSGFKENISLKPHQHVARAWMRESEYDPRRMGGILADDMGLGKTIEMLVCFVDHREELKRIDKEMEITSLKRPTLIVCPRAVLEQWGEEITKFVKRQPRVIVFHTESLGSAGIKRLTMADLLNAEIIIATYDKVRNQHKDVQQLPDEGQKIKNPDIKVSAACYALEGKYRWVLTGTPIQNGPLDIFSFFCFLRIEPLNDRAWFEREILRPLKNNSSSRRPLDLLRIARNILILRRRKDDRLPNDQKILPLEDMKIKTIYCELSKVERALYEALRTKVANALTRILDDAAVKAERCLPSKYIIVRLMRLRQASLHPALILKDDEFTEEEVDSFIDKALYEGHVLGSDECPLCGLEDNFRSAKLNAILDLLRTIRKRSEKTIVFSQFTSMLDIIGDFLCRQGLVCARYDGSMNAKQRLDALEMIKGKRANIILMSLMAGGTGKYSDERLNLAECNNVILVDPWWNPAVELQAFGRVHRIGQTRQVNIYKLISKDTIEERILEMQRKKATFADDVLDSDQAKAIGKLSPKEILELVALSTGTRRTGHY